MLKSLSFKVKLFGLVLCLIGLSAVVGTVSLYTSRKIMTESEHIVTVNVASIWNLAFMRNEAHNVIRNVIKLSVPGNSADEIKHINGSLNKAIAAFKTSNDEYSKAPKSLDEEKSFQELQATWSNFLNVAEKTANELNSNDPTTRSVGLNTLHTSFDHEYHAVFDAIAKGVDLQFKDTQSHVERSKEIEHSSIQSIALFTILGSLIGLVTGFALSRSMTRSLNTISAKLAEQAVSVASASEQISQSSTELSTSAVKQAAAIQQTAASVEEVNAMVAKNAANAQKSQTCSAESKEIAIKGRQSMEQMIQAIHDISQNNSEMKQAINTTNQELASIVTLIGDIESKTKVINDIVFQTKLLSFNASVEAARAGEQGKGFSVVAEEIGNLAQLSGSAAHEIAEMLGSSTKKVESIAQATKDRIESLLESGNRKMETGIKSAEECQGALKEITESVSNVSNMVQEITTASTEQAKGVEEITQAISQLEQATQQNSAVSQQSATASEALAGQSSVVHNLVQELVQVVEGARSDRAA